MSNLLKAEDDRSEIFIIGEIVPVLCAVEVLLMGLLDMNVNTKVVRQFLFYVIFYKLYKKEIS